MSCQCTDLGCPHSGAENQDADALVRFGVTRRIDVWVHEQDEDNNHNNEGAYPWSSAERRAKSL